MAKIAYRGYWIEYDPKPIPASFGCDWSFWHQDYDGAPAEPGGPPADQRCGTAASLDEAKREIDEQIAEEQPPCPECNGTGDAVAYRHGTGIRVGTVETGCDACGGSGRATPGAE